MTRLSSPRGQDRRVVEKFVSFYFRELRLQHDSLCFPEDDSAIPSDCKIDCVAPFSCCQMLVEHTSIDLISSGNTKKRELDPGFLFVQAELENIHCAAGKGLKVGLRFEDAKNISRLKRIAQLLRKEIEQYFVSTAPKEWDKNPRVPDVVQVEGVGFQLRPVALFDKVILHWLGTDNNFLDEAEIEQEIRRIGSRKQKTLQNKLAKLDRYHAITKAPSFPVLIVETNDVAAASFHSCCGAFARLMAHGNNHCSEIWGLFGDSKPLLVWFEELDRGRVDDVYRDDPYYRSAAEIDAGRMRIWRGKRGQWFLDHAAPSLGAVRPQTAISEPSVMAAKGGIQETFSKN
jgi:hypothetical protein